MANNPIGFLTNVFFRNGVTEVSEVAKFAKENLFDHVELGPTYDLSVETISAFLDQGIQISDLIYCRNLLIEEETSREKHKFEVLQRIEIASRFEIPLVTVSAGIVDVPRGEVYDRYETFRTLPEASLEPFVEVYKPIIEMAEAKGVKIAIENCPCMGNWAISPYLWEMMFDKVDSKNFGLTYDPSHLIWLFIEPYEPLKKFKDRIFAIHAKDTSIDEELLKERGILGDFSWWKYRIPGKGQLDWKKFADILNQTNFDGPVTIEHEDPVYTGSLEKVTEGVLLARDHLKPLFT